MTFCTLIRRSLRFHWRAHLGVMLGASVGSAALIGALVVGDSVKGSLRQQALGGLGWTTVAMSSGDQLFFSGLADHYIPKHYGRPWTVRASAALHSTGVAARPDGEGRANRVNIFGIDERFGEEGSSLEKISKGTVVINRPLANQLSLKGGDEIVLRIQSISGPSGDMVMTSKADATRMLRMGVSGIAAADQMGNFSLQGGSAPPFNAFLNLEELGEKLGVIRQANTLLLGEHEITRGERDLRILLKLSKTGRLFGDWRRRFQSVIGEKHISEEYVPASPEVTLEFASDELLNVPSPGYWGIKVQADERGWLEINSREVFIPRALAEAARNIDTNTWGLVSGVPLTEMLRPVEIRFLERPAQPILTYLANLLRAGTNMAPYSMVTAAGPPWTPGDMRDDEILVSRWLADDLQVQPADAIALSYFDPESGAQLVERTNTFRVRGVVPMEMPWLDRTLMPDFPGIEKAESTRDWDAGFPLVHEIRPKDEDYWKQFRGTPKAFIALAAGQKLWANRFGNLTAIRFPIPTNAPLTPALSPSEGARENPSPPQSEPGAAVSSTASRQSEAGQRPSPLPGGEGQGEGERRANTAESFRAALEKKILTNLKPEELGLRFEPVREQALKAAEQSQDFGGLFLGFSLFLIAAALLLMAMLFQLGLEQRAPEIGTLLALGFTPRQVRKLLLGEGVALSLVGGVLGALGGLAYAKAMLHGLTTVWRDAVGATTLSFHVTAQTMIIGLLASLVVSVVTIWLTLRKFVRRAPRELLAGEVEDGNRSLPDGVAQTSESAVSQVSKPASRATFGTLPIWKSAMQQVGKPALRQRGKRPPTPVMLAHFKVGWLALVVAGALVGGMMLLGDTANAGAFFGAGALVLLAGLAFISAWLASLASDRALPLTPALPLLLVGTRSPRVSDTRTENGDAGGTRPYRVQEANARIPRGDFCASDEERVSAGPVSGQPVTLTSLGLRGCARRRKRSLATVAMLACGSFLIVSIGVFRLDANRDAWKRTSGTGGFALIGETTMPVVQDLNSQSGRDFFALNEDDLKGVSFVPFRVREGDEASCLNLNRAQQPRLLGVKPEILEGRFTVVKGGGWQSLRSSRREEAQTSNAGVDQSLLTSAATNEVAAIGDANSIRWAMHKKVGGAIDYVDERGQPFKVRIVGAVANSILQGQLIVDEAEFVRRFPGESGYRMFLIDAPSNRVAEVSATLSRAMQDVGLELTPAAQRLAQFNAVQNTYLGTFQVLGGLGLLLGSVGLGIVVLRNVLERRGELAVLLAVGFRKTTLQRLLLIENGSLLGLGLASGVVAAAVAALPALLSPGTQLPWLTLTLTLAAVLLNGGLWTWAATRSALRGDLLAALRNE